MYGSINNGNRARSWLLINLGSLRQKGDATMKAPSLPILIEMSEEWVLGWQIGKETDFWAKPSKRLA